MCEAQQFFSSPMFPTPDDIATHEDPWASVLRIGLRYVAERVCGDLADPNDPWVFGVGIFDRLTLGQKVVMLAMVGKAMLDAHEPAPDLTAVVDATALVIVDAFAAAVVIETDTDASLTSEDDRGPWLFTSRTALRNVLEPGWDTRQLGPLPSVDSTDLDEWQELAACLAEMVLFDADCEMEHLFVDDPPEQSDALKEKLGIDDDYFQIPAPDPTDEEFRNHLFVLEALTGLRFDASQLGN